MCDSCSSASAEFSTTTWRKARKPHRRDECCRPIVPGERYAREFGKFEGDVFHNCICLRCAKVSRAHFAAARAIQEDCSPLLGELRQSIGECCRENSEYVKAFREAWRAAA